MSKCNNMGTGIGGSGASALYASRTRLPAENVYAEVPFHGGDGGPSGAAYGRVGDLLHLVEIWQDGTVQARRRTHRILVATPRG